MLPDTESLRCFEATATLLSFRAAAARVALSPAALSDRIRRLEESLGEPLFLRTTRKVQLTSAGERLLPHVRSLLEAHARCIQLVKEGPAEVPLELSIGTRYELGLSWLVPALPRLERAQANRQLHLAFGDGRELLARVRRGDLDAAITSSRIAEGALETCALHPETYLLVGARRPLEAHPLRGPADALHHALVDLTPDLPLSRYFLDQAGGSAQWRFRRLEFLGTLAAVRMRVLQGRGVAVLPAYFIEPDLKRGRLRVLLPKTPLQQDWFRLVWRREHARAEDLRRLGEELRQLPLR